MLWFCVVELVVWVFSLKDFSLLEALQAACGYICVLLCMGVSLYVQRKQSSMVCGEEGSC